MSIPVRFSRSSPRFTRSRRSLRPSCMRPSAGFSMPVPHAKASNVDRCSLGRSCNQRSLCALGVLGRECTRGRVRRQGVQGQHRVLGLRAVREGEGRLLGNLDGSLHSEAVRMPARDGARLRMRQLDVRERLRAEEGGHVVQACRRMQRNKRAVSWLRSGGSLGPERAPAYFFA